MVEYAQAWRKKLRIKHLVDIAKDELGENYNDGHQKKFKKNWIQK